MARIGGDEFDGAVRLAGAFGVPRAAALARDLLASQGCGDAASGAEVVEDSLAPLGGELSSATAAVALGQRNTAAPAVLVRATAAGTLSVVFDGGLVNAGALREEALRSGAVFSGNTPAELLLHRIARSSQTTLVNRVVDALMNLRGGYATLLLTPDRLVAARDPWGIRSLALARLDGGVVLATERAALEQLEPREIWELKPGEVLIADPRGASAMRPFPRQVRRSCLLDLVVLDRPDGQRAGRPVFADRERLGKLLATVAPGDADVVVAGSVAARPAAHGYGVIESLPVREALVALPGGRWRGVRAAVAGRRVLLVRATLTRGVGARDQVRALRDAGAAAVHVRVVMPRIQQRCPYGVPMPEGDALIAAHLRAPEITTFVGCDSLAYLDADALDAALGPEPPGLCRGCSNGVFPVPTEPGADHTQLPLFRGDVPPAV